MKFPAQITDQLGRTIRLEEQPRRIISIVPSQTELLYDLGLDNEVIGITKFCIHPDSWHKTKTHIGGTKQLHIEKTISLQPDLIIANKEENDRDQVLELAQHFPVYISDITTLDQATEMIRSVGELCGKKNIAEEISKNIESGFYSLNNILKTQNEKSVAYLIWKKPYMAAGRGTFINTMLEACGFKNIFSDGDGRYPECTLDELQMLKPDFIFLSSEPYPFTEKHAAEFAALSSHTKIIPVDGEMFSWYGSRLQKAPAYFERLLKSV